MTAELVIDVARDACMVPDVESLNEFQIMLNGKSVGRVTIDKLSDINCSILDDVDMEEEWDILHPLFKRIQQENGVYLDVIAIDEEYQGMGIGQQIIGDLLKQNRPVLVYSLSEAEGFWLKMKFKNVCGYYYVWQANKEAF